MTRQFIQKVYIEDEEIFGADQITMEFNLDNIIQTLSLKIPDPYAIKEYMRKQAKIEVYCGYVDNANNVAQTDLIKRFSGYITAVPRSIAKDSRDLSISAMDKLEFLTRNELQIRIGGDSSLQAFLELLIGQISGLYPEYTLSYYISADIINVIPNIGSSTNAIELLTSVRDDVVINIFYNPMLDMLQIISPYFVQYLFRDAAVETYDFNLSNIVGSLDYGDITSNINKVIYVGVMGVKGVATDYSAIALGQGGQELRFYDMSTGSKELLEEKARNKLLEIQQNHIINFQIPFVESVLNIMPGEMCTIDDDDKFTGNELFVIKSVNINISKDDVSASISAYAHTLSEFPEDLVLTKFGIADEDMLTVLEKEAQGDFT